LVKRCGLNKSPPKPVWVWSKKVPENRLTRTNFQVNRIMSVHGPQRAVVQCLLQAKSRSTQSMAYHKIFLVPPTLPGHSLFYINYDHWSLIKRPICMVLDLLRMSA
jgi:hypothetical protein